MKAKIIAAGGLVQNERGDLLMIFRNGIWDLPKGKLEANETIEACAVREVQEETGLTDISLKKFIAHTSHNYFDKYAKQHCIKETHWYAMVAKSTQPLTPQITEGIDRIEWVSEKQATYNLQNSYPNIIALVNSFWKKMPN